MSELQELIGALKEQTNAISALANGQQKSAFTATNADTQYPRGAQSIWGNLPVERDIITAHVRPEGLASQLPWFPSTTEQPFYGVLTGFTADSGSEATNPCDPNPSGFVKACTLTAQFGRLARDTNVIDIDKVMLRLNRGDFTDYQMRGRMLGLTDLTPTPDESGMLNVVTKSEMVIASHSIERKLTELFWQGSPANNTSGGGYKEPPGLDSQIATGQVDANTGVACPAVDSDVKNFNYDFVGGSGRDIVEYLGMLEFYLRHNARKMGLDPVQWIVVMRPELWFELSAVWPCAYNTNKCANSVTGDASRVVLDGRENVAERDAMRNQRYIDINGNRYNVVLDDGIFEHNNTNNGNLGLGQYASSIYFVPLTITGGWPVTYIEHVDYRGASADMSLISRGYPSFWTDDGRYMWVFEQNRFCYLLSAKIEPRIVLRTPHLAGKIDAVGYEPLQHLRSYDPDSPYHYDGGVSLRGDPWSTNAVWLS